MKIYESESRCLLLLLFFLAFRLRQTQGSMVEVKLCVGKLDGTTEYRRIGIPLLSHSTDVLSVLRAKLAQLFPELTNDSHGIDVEFQYEGKTRSSPNERMVTRCPAVLR